MFDGKLTGSITRYQLPVPISGLYNKFRSAPTYALRYGYALLLVEGIFRFLAFVNYANAIAVGATKNEKKDWIQWLTSPSMGKLLGLCRQASKRISASNEPPFAPELKELIHSDGWDHLQTVFPKERNHFAHRRMATSDEYAEEQLALIEPDLKKLLDGLQWLKNYRLGTFTNVKAPSRRRKHYSADWRASRGRGQERYDTVQAPQGAVYGRNETPEQNGTGPRT